MSTSEIVDLEARSSEVEVLSGDACTDEQAIAIFLNTYAGRSPHTVRSYQKECRRFLLWLNAVRGANPCLLPSVSVTDINSYQQFLAAPRPFSEAFLLANGWKSQPFRKPLGTASLHLCISVLHKMFDALRELRDGRDQPFCRFNPLRLAHKGTLGAQSEDPIEQALTSAEWDAVQSAIENLPRNSNREKKHYHRARWTMQLLYRAFLRRDEAAQLRMGNFVPTVDGWEIALVGKGNKKARIIAPNKLIEELKVYRLSLGLDPLPCFGETRPAILALTGREKGLSAQAIYLLCNELFERAALRLDASDPHGAARLRQATPHWMRHTGISHAMDIGVNPRHVQAQARHSSLKTTAKYDHKARLSWRRDLEKI